MFLNFIFKSIFRPNFIPASSNILIFEGLECNILDLDSCASSESDPVLCVLHLAEAALDLGSFNDFTYMLLKIATAYDSSSSTRL